MFSKDCERRAEPRGVRLRSCRTERWGLIRAPVSVLAVICLALLALAPAAQVQAAPIEVTSHSNVTTAYFDNVRLEEIESMPEHTSAPQPAPPANPSPGRNAGVELLQEATPTEGQVGFRPRDGAVVTTNPPSFVWLPVPGATTYILEYSPDPSFPEGQTTRVTGIDLPLYTPAATLSSQTAWYWRYRAVLSGSGTLSPYSPVRSFQIAPDAAAFPLPSLDELHRRIPQSHPRLFVRPETLEELRRLASDPRAARIYEELLTDAEFELQLRKDAPLPPEPGDPMASGTFDAQVWRDGMLMARSTTETMQNLAFLYLISGRRDIGELAKRWLLHFASWDPHGTSSAAKNDEVSMALLYRMSRAYTWLYDLLTPEERTKVREVMRERGQEAYRILRSLPFEVNPHNSHGGRTLGFLGEAAIAFFDEIPEAREWFDYVVRVFYALYPAWGGDDGGWAEGASYWKYYMQFVSEFVDALAVATGTDLMAKPFFRNTGYFKLYVHSPGTGNPFGDGNGEPVAALDTEVMGWLARANQNPYFQWYVENSPGSPLPRSIFGFLRAARSPAPQAKPPVDLPQARLFRDVGWVAMHSNLASPEDDIRLVFKSSPYGSYSHSHADQNAFVLDAFGRPLVISSGYYPWYMSPHHANWTQQSISQNTILVDGRGQIPRSLAAKGEITRFFTTAAYDYTVGDASAAYTSPLLQFNRHILFVRPHFFVIFDELSASRRVRYDFLLHSPLVVNTLDEAAQKVSIFNWPARLDVCFLASQLLDLAADDRFVPAPELPNLPNQWHLRARSPQTEDFQFLTVLLPQRIDGQPTSAITEVLEVQRWTDPDVAGAKVRYKTGDGEIWTQYVAFRPAGAGSSDSPNGPKSPAALFAFGSDASGRKGQLLTVDGLILRLPGDTASTSGTDHPIWLSRPATISARWSAEDGDGGGTLLELDVVEQAKSPDALQIRLALSVQPALVVVNGKALSEKSWRYTGGVLELVVDAGARADENR
ncbi:MAG: DUF4962 domain-containing protein [Limnochordales bacterium]|nr:DUF4962 domain-containing protein [Limnochordales bacterium]